MAAALGSVVVELSANIAKFESALTKSAAIAEQRAKEIDKSLGIVKTSLSVLGAGFLANATFDKIKEKITGAIESAAGLQKISEQTGVAVGALSGLVAVAKLTNTSSEDLATGIQKLSKSMIDAENGGKKTGATFAAIGISIQQLKGLNTDQLFQLIAEKLSHFQDGAEKVVVAQNLLGKAGANLLPVLHDLAEIGDLQVKVTAAQAKVAEEYEKNLVRLNAASNALYKQIALELVPVLNDLTKAFIEVQTNSNGVKKTVAELAADGSIRKFAQDAALGAAVVIETFQGLIKGAIAVGHSFQAVFADINVFGTFAKNGAVLGLAFESNRIELAQALEKRNQTYKVASDKYQDLFNFDARAIEKNLKARFAGSNAEADFAKNADARDLRARALVDAAAKKPKINTSKFGNKNKEGGGAADDPAQKLLDGQLKAQENFIASNNKLLAQREQSLSFYTGLEFFTLREEIEIKKRLIAETLQENESAFKIEAALLEKRIRTADTEVKRQDARNKLEEVKKRQLDAEIDGNNLLIQSNEKVLAIKVKFDLATAEVSRQADKSNDTARFQISLLGKTTLEVQQLTAARTIQLALDERIFQLQKEDKSVDVSEAVRKSNEEQIESGKLIEESYARQRQGAFGVSEAIRKYGEAANDAAGQIEATVGNAFKGLEDVLVQFSLTGKLSFTSLANSIVADITRIIIKQQISNALGVAGSGGSTSGILGSLVGGLFGTEGIATLASSLPGDPLSNFINLSGQRASGGPVDGGRYLVGEKGPEILNMNGATGNIIPNSQIRAGDAQPQSNNVVNITNNFPEGVSRDSVNQAAARQGLQVQRALRSIG